MYKRELFDWYLDALDTYHPQQIEFARLNLNFTVVSKRKLKRLVDERVVDGWDDPRMPTISGLRRRGYTPLSVRKFSESVGVTKRDTVVDVAKLENALRHDLNKIAPRVMSVLDPLKVVITNYPVDKVEYVDAVNNPEDKSAGTRKIAFTRELFIERADYMDDPPKKFFRLAPGREVRLKYAYFVTCSNVVKSETGDITELHCTYDPKTKGGAAHDGRRVKGTLQWVSATENISAKVNLYDRLFINDNPEEGGDFMNNLNPNSLKIVESAFLERSLSEPVHGCTYQFERLGYFIADKDHSIPGRPVFNRAVSLRDSWAKQIKKVHK